MSLNPSGHPLMEALSRGDWFFTANVEGEKADGVLRVIAVNDAPASDVTLMVRPLDTLLAGVKAMGRALAERAKPD